MKVLLLSVSVLASLASSSLLAAIREQINASIVRKTANVKITGQRYCSVCGVSRDESCGLLGLRRSVDLREELV